MNKAFSTIEIKSFNESEGIIRGIASTPSVDKIGDVVEPLGAQFSLPLPLHFEHDRKDCIGEVFEAVATPAGIEFSARIAKDVSGQIAEVWKRVHAGLIKYVSVGFRALQSEQIKGGIRYTQWAWDELSLTTVPANSNALITSTKTAPPRTSINKGTTMTLAQQIASFQAKKSAALASMDIFVSKGTTLIGDDEVAYAAAELEVADIEKHLVRLIAAEDRQAKSAVPVGIKFIQVEDNSPKGSDFTRYFKSIALAGGNIMHAEVIAKAQYPDAHRLHTVMKAAVSAGSVTDTSFAKPLVAQVTMVSEFIDLLRPATIVGKLPGLRTVPQDVRIPRQTGATAVNWVGEGKASPLTNAAYSDLTLGHHKLSAIVAVTDELLASSDPSIEALLRDDLIKSVGTATDVAFADPASAGATDVKPASVANGITPRAASGTTAAAVRADVSSIIGTLIAANQSTDGGAWVMHQIVAFSLSQMVNPTTSQPEFPGITMQGGVFYGLPVVVSSSVPATPTVGGYPIQLVIQSEILIAEGGLSVVASKEASLEMSDAPTGDSKTPTATTMVSMFQTSSTAIKVLRGITWARRRPTAVAIITGCKYA